MTKLVCDKCEKDLSAGVKEGSHIDYKCCYLTRKRAYFEDRWTRGGGFMTTLCKLITIADGSNLKKLYLAYPDLVEGYISYSQGLTYEEWVKR